MFRYGRYGHRGAKILTETRTVTGGKPNEGFVKTHQLCCAKVRYLPGRANDRHAGSREIGWACSLSESEPPGALANESLVMESAYRRIRDRVARQHEELSKSGELNRHHQRFASKRLTVKK